MLTLAGACYTPHMAVEPGTRELTVSKDDRVALPPDALRRLGWHEGDRLRLSESGDGKLVLTATSGESVAEQPVSPAEALERFRQAFKGVFDGVDPVAYQRVLRDEWQEPYAYREARKSAPEPASDD